jgi:hypothetical protein
MTATGKADKGIGVARPRWSKRKRRNIGSPNFDVGTQRSLYYGATPCQKNWRDGKWDKIIKIVTIIGKNGIPNGTGYEAYKAGKSRIHWVEIGKTSNGVFAVPKFLGHFEEYTMQISKIEAYRFLKSNPV